MSATDPNPKPVQKTAHWAKWVWIAILAGAGAFELWGVFSPTEDDTLSEVTRLIFHTDTEAGAWIFRIFWVAFAAWFGPHIVKLTRQKVAARKEES